jgi:hypothetical protein
MLLVQLYHMSLIAGKLSVGASLMRFKLAVQALGSPAEPCLSVHLHADKHY